MAASKVAKPVKSKLQGTLSQRGTVHGDFSENSEVSQTMKAIIRKQNGFSSLSLDKREALDMIVHKIARILSGNPNHKDHWHDIAGYATLAEERCED